MLRSPRLHRRAGRAWYIEGDPDQHGNPSRHRDDTHHVVGNQANLMATYLGEASEKPRLRTRRHRALAVLVIMTAERGHYRFLSFLMVARLFSARSTASRTKSVRLSSSFNTASICLNVPSGKRACISSSQSFARTMFFSSYEDIELYPDMRIDNLI